MSVFDQAKSGVAKTIAWLAAAQDEQGRWTGSMRSNCCVWYAAGLALLGEKPDSAGIADICDYLESCAAADGGIGAHPGEPSSALETSMALPLFTWAGRRSTVVGRAREYLRNHGPEYRDPVTQMFRWIFEPDRRAAVLADSGPHPWFQRLLLYASRKHPSERWDLSRRYPHSYRPPGVIERTLSAAIMRGLTYPPVDHLEMASRRSPQPMGFDATLLIVAGFRRLAGDTSEAAVRLTEHALSRRRLFFERAGFYEGIHPIVAVLFFTTALGIEKERQGAISAFRGIRYEGNGWLRGTRISINIFDTALTVMALKSVGLAADHPIVKKACEFLIGARRPEDELWSWAYDTAEGCRPGQPDTDDSGAASMALAWAEARADRNWAAGLGAMQEENGSFSTFGGDVLRPNWCWISNSSRAVQGMIMAGADRDSEPIRRGLTWIRSQQLQDGTWIDGWCPRYIYGTAMAVEGLMRAGASSRDPAIRRAASWLLRTQNPDGGWGEDWCGSPARSSPEHTGLALYALCLSSEAGECPRDAIENGIAWLLKAQRDDGTWGASYFVDFGFGTGFADSQLPIVWALHGLGEAIRILATPDRP